MRFLCSFHYGFYCDVKLRNLYSFLMFVACCSKSALDLVQNSCHR